MAANKNLLQNVYLFKNLTAEQLSMIAAAGHLETYAAGDDIFAQGDQAKALYIIKYGSVRILQKTKSGESIEVATLGTGSHFGEMALVDGEPRSASAEVVEKSEIVIVEYDKLISILNDDVNIAASFYKELAHFLCGRLRITTNDLGFAREKNLSHF